MNTAKEFLKKKWNYSDNIYVMRRGENFQAQCSIADLESILDEHAQPFKEENERLKQENEKKDRVIEAWETNYKNLKSARDKQILSLNQELERKESQAIGFAEWFCKQQFYSHNETCVTSEVTKETYTTTPGKNNIYTKYQQSLKQ